MTEVHLNHVIQFFLARIEQCPHQSRFLAGEKSGHILYDTCA